MRVFAIAAAISLGACAAAPVLVQREPEHVHGSAPALTEAAGLIVSGPADRKIPFSAADLKVLPRVMIEADLHGEKHIFEGVPLIELLKQAGVPSGNDLRGAELLHVIIVTARDGYRVALSLAEIDPGISPTRVIIADKADGQPIPDTDGPFRLVVESDLRAARSVRMVEGVEILKVE